MGRKTDRWKHLSAMGHHAANSKKAKRENKENAENVRGDNSLAPRQARGNDQNNRFRDGDHVGAVLRDLTSARNTPGKSDLGHLNI